MNLPVFVTAVGSMHGESTMLYLHV